MRAVRYPVLGDPALHCFGVDADSLTELGQGQAGFENRRPESLVGHGPPSISSRDVLSNRRRPRTSCHVVTASRPLAMCLFTAPRPIGPNNNHAGSEESLGQRRFRLWITAPAGLAVDNFHGLEPNSALLKRIRRSEDQQTGRPAT